MRPRPHRIIPIIPALILGIACRPDAVSAPDRGPVLLADHRSDDDDDSRLTVKCATGDFTTIQAAVDAAEAGSTIVVCTGTYNERVVISGTGKNGLRVLARGRPGTVVLDGNDPHHADHAFHLLNVTGVLIQGFTVREYFENIKMTGGGGHTIRRNRTTAAGHDGIFALNSANNVIEHNVSFDNPSGNACGVNIAGPGAVGNVIRHNRLLNNNWGIRIQGGATNTVAVRNHSAGNRAHGIISIGAATNGATIRSNQVEDNPIGIEVNASSGVSVLRNRVRRSATFDLLLVGSGTNNTFVNNRCRTSMPDGLCRQGDDDDDDEEGEGSV